MTKTETFKSPVKVIWMIIGNCHFQFELQGTRGDFYTLEKRMFEIKCSDCGKTATVPFKPTVGKPVYCGTCFQKHAFKQRENIGTNLNFDEKQAWARRGDTWRGRKEETPSNVFQGS